MKKTAIFFLAGVLVFLRNVHAESVNAVEAVLISAMQKTDNSYMTVVKTEESKSGWAIRVEKRITAKQSFGDISVSMLTRTEAKGPFKEFYTVFLCSLLDNLDVTKNFLAKQIIDMIFPKQKGSCVLKASERAIRKSAQVNPKSIKNRELKVSLPENTPYELEVRFLTSKQFQKHPEKEYFLKLNFNIGGDINKK